MAKVVPIIPPGPHYAGDEHYWTVMRDGRVERTSRSLRQCEVGAIRGNRYLCCLFAAAIPTDPTCPVCGGGQDI